MHVSVWAWHSIALASCLGRFLACFCLANLMLLCLLLHSARAWRAVDLRAAPFGLRALVRRACAGGRGNEEASIHEGRQLQLSFSVPGISTWWRLGSRIWGKKNAKTMTNGHHYPDHIPMPCAIASLLSFSAFCFYVAAVVTSPHINSPAFLFLQFILKFSKDSAKLDCCISQCVTYQHIPHCPNRLSMF